MNNKPDPMELFKEAAFKYKTTSKSCIDEYRNTLVALHIKRTNKKDMLNFLIKRGVKTSYTALWKYLNKKPITNEEINNIMKLIEKNSNG
ncbi:MAG TPA: hypothetical protein QF753_17080 [Victivallales bacterium]|nr:hypothetical protein [Victivallales bacterium]